MNKIIRTIIYTGIYCALGAEALCALSAVVQAAEDAPHKTVKFGDLNISNPEGAKALYGRIRAAARDVCEMSATYEWLARPAVKKCIDTAIDKAVKDVNAPELTALRFGGNTRLASK